MNFMRAIFSKHRYSKLYLIGDQASWVLDNEARELANIAQQIGINVEYPKELENTKNQCVFFASRYSILGGEWKEIHHRIATSYFHGRPGSGEPSFDRLYQNLCQRHQYIDRIQVSHSEMKDVVLSSGIDEQKVFLIPIGINLAYFKKQTFLSKDTSRSKLGIPKTAVVIGSFQKDGAFWEAGLQPKLIKGPDILLKTIELLKSRIPELFVLLSGPARGYVKKGLDDLSVPYIHRYLENYADVGELYQALDVYVVTSRQEGGPKAVLETMASGVPLVTTRVGQAMDLVKHGENGWMVEIEDAAGLAFWVEYVLQHRESLENVILHGLDTAKNNSYDSQLPLWKIFFRGFVDW